MPDFAQLREGNPFVAGLRPVRQGGMRIGPGRSAVLNEAGKQVVHNYGHGGAGISLSFGASERVREAVGQALEKEPDAAKKTEVAVLGCGVAGLTSAFALKRRWPELVVTVYAAECDVAQTTSWKAGGLFASPAQLTEVDSDIAQKQLQQSKDVLDQLGRTPRLHARLGISRCPGYVLDDRGGTRLQLGANVHRSRAYETWLIDPVVLLPALKADLEQRGVRFVSRRFEMLADVAKLPEPIIVNCTGLGARDLFGDTTVEALRGHLVVLKNPEKLKYMLTGWCEAGTQYLFARTNDIVIGGTMYRGNEAADYDPANPSDVATCQRILRNASGLFAKGGRECG